MISLSDTFLGCCYVLRRARRRHLKQAAVMPAFDLFVINLLFFSEAPFQP